MARFDFMTLEGRMGGVPESSWLGAVYLTSTESRAVWCFQPKESATITHLGIRVSGVSGTPPQYRISLRTLLSTGLPSSVLMASKVFTPLSTWGGTFQWIELLAPMNVRRGEKIAMVVEYYSGYVSSGNYLAVTSVIEGVHARQGNFPYFYNPQGNPAKYGAHLVYGMKSSTRAYGCPIKEIEFNSINVPKEIGLRILLNSEFGTTFKLRGAMIEAALQASAGNSLDMILYDSFNNVLNNVTIDCDVAEHWGSATGTSRFLFDDATLATLTMGKEYFLAFAPKNAAMNFTLRVLECESNEDATAFPGGSAFYLVTRNTSSDGWTRERAKRPLVDLLVDDWTK